MSDQIRTTTPKATFAIVFLGLAIAVGVVVALLGGLLSLVGGRLRS